MARAGIETARASVPGAQDAGAPGEADDGPPQARPGGATLGQPVTLAESLMLQAGWPPSCFGQHGPNPPYVRIGGKLRVSLTEFEPCFSSVRRDRWLFRSKVSMADHLDRYDRIMVEPVAFEECFGPGEGNEAVFPFGAWLSIRGISFAGIKLWGKRQGDVLLPLEPLAIASAIWLRRGVPPSPHNIDEEDAPVGQRR